MKKRLTGAIVALMSLVLAGGSAWGWFQVN